MDNSHGVLREQDGWQDRVKVSVRSGCGPSGAAAEHTVSLHPGEFFQPACPLTEDSHSGRLRWQGNAGKFMGYMGAQGPGLSLTPNRSPGTKIAGWRGAEWGAVDMPIAMVMVWL